MNLKPLIGGVLVMLAPHLAWAQSVTFTTLVNFDGTNGLAPIAPLIQAEDGNFYGTTSGGGIANANYLLGGGTVFQMNPTGSISTVFSFASGGGGAHAGLVQRKYDGSLRGILPESGESAFIMTTNGEFLGTVSIGGLVDGSLIEGTDGNFYGTTENGGSSNYGSVFRITFNGELVTLYSFAPASQSNLTNTGTSPACPLLQIAGGNMYGTTLSGGWNNAGTVFEITTNGNLSILYSFTGGDDGYMPSGGLIRGLDGRLYGTTQYGGTNDTASGGLGTIYAISTNGTFATLASFDGTSGANPISGLVQGDDASFYGTAPNGGTGQGTIFRVSPGGALNGLYSFGSITNTNGIALDGAVPMAGLAKTRNGAFYGTTRRGGAYNFGTVFSFTLGAATPPVILNILRNSNGITLTWNASTGNTYQVQYCTNTFSANWKNLGTPLSAAGSTLSVQDSNAIENERFYRVVLQSLGTP